MNLLIWLSAIAATVVTVKALEKTQQALTDDDGADTLWA